MNLPRGLVAGPLMALVVVAGCGGSSSPLDAADGPKDTAGDTVTTDAPFGAAPTPDASQETMPDAGAPEAKPDASTTETSPDTAATPDVGTEAPADAAPDAVSEAASDAAGLCVAFANAAPTMKLVKLAESAPTPAGGTIVDGLYSVIALITYTGTGGEVSSVDGTYHETDQFLGGTWNGRTTFNATSQDFSFSSTYTISGGHTLDITKTCGTLNPTPQNYTATPTEVRFIMGSIVVLLKKQ